MKSFWTITLLLFLCIGSAQGQVDFTSSDLPIVILDSDGIDYNQEEKVISTLSIIYNGPGQRNQLTDPPTEYIGQSGVKIRGESSTNFYKKSYAIELWDDQGMDIDTGFLGFPPEEDFILYGPYSDKTLMNNVLIMHLAREMGQYASKTRYVELVINEKYIGLYVLMEKIKRDKGRLDIAKLKPTDLTGDELTGGYILRIDKGTYDGWQSDYLCYESDSKRPFYQYYYPDQDVIQEEQRSYINTYLGDFENAVMSSDYYNDQGLHYTKYIALRSFVDHFILSEFSKDVDAYRLSTYFHKQKDSQGGRLHIGPVWDYNLSLGNADYCETDIPMGWIYYSCKGSSPAWWDRMLQDDIFSNALQCRYSSLRQDLLSMDNLDELIDAWSSEIDEAQLRNFERWKILGEYVWPNPTFFASALSHEEAVSIMKLWISNRLEWLDNNMPGIAIDCERYNHPNYDIDLSNTTALSVKPIIEVYPNPSEGELQVRSSEKILNLSLHDLLGNLVLEVQPNSKRSQFNTLDIKGSYFLRIKSAAGMTSRKVILQ